MPLEDIESPPYPGWGCTDDLLLRHFEHVREWVLFYRDELNDEFDQEMIPEITEIPTLDLYIRLPVPTKYEHWLRIRIVRERWDELVRMYETCWTSRPALEFRTCLIQATTFMVNNAFIPFEHKEAKQREHEERTRQMFEDILNGIAHAGIRQSKKRRKKKWEEGEENEE